MNETGATFVMILLFALRCIVPLLLTVFIGWLMNRLVDRWEAEETAAPAQPKPQPPQEAPANVPRRSIPDIVNCWVFRNCAESDCAAYENTAVPCWQIKKSSLGQLAEQCETCPFYRKTAPAL